MFVCDFDCDSGLMYVSMIAYRYIHECDFDFPSCDEILSVNQRKSHEQVFHKYVSFVTGTILSRERTTNKSFTNMPYLT